MSRILVVDDDPQIRRMLEMRLEIEGHEVYLAEDGGGALEALEACLDGIDVVITDIVMPEKEGLELIHELRRRHYNVKIIAMSGGGQLHPLTYLRMAKTLKADRTFRKPLEMKEMLAALKELTGETDRTAERK